MRTLLIIVAVLCLVGWLFAVFVYSTLGAVHILILLAFAGFLIGIIKKKERDA